MLGLMTLFGAGMYPNLVFSNPGAANSLTIRNASSSPHTLEIMLVIALAGLPCVLAYTAAIHWIFRGKTRLTGDSY
jgi:cytochrome d ubiquinol oxidase subunit II